VPLIPCHEQFDLVDMLVGCFGSVDKKMLFVSAKCSCYWEVLILSSIMPSPDLILNLCALFLTQCVLHHTLHRNRTCTSRTSLFYQAHVLRLLGPER
jgi:hypothetical protein